MGDERANRNSKRISSTDHGQVDSDFATAPLESQEEQETLTMLTSSESESDDDDDCTSYSTGESNIDELLEIQAELEVLEEEEESHQEMEEDDIDPDELSYEDLIALGEFVGEESRGLSAHEISSLLHQYEHQGHVNTKTLIDRCVICQLEYEKGEILVALACNHPYHSDCISQWLQIKKICPICSTEVSSPKVCGNV